VLRKTFAYAAVVAGLGFLTAACASRPPSYASPPASQANQQPDKLLFDRAVDDIEHGHYERARLALQTLVNTYPSSEYLPQAELAIADSWYREGTAQSLMQARAACRQVIVQFPTNPSASQAAQLMVRIEADLAKKGQPAK
jgi:outer membrane protein assembly factor BamD